MASMSFPSLILFLSLWVSLMSTACSLTCMSENLPDSKKTFANCTDLPTFNATLHYNYNAEDFTLSVAFAVAPASPEGWTAWAINPTGTGMVGSQALLAFKSNGSLLVKKYNISSYSSIEQTDELSFDLWDLAMETIASGKYVIYASLHIPSKFILHSAVNLSYMWQVGASATNGRPGRHEFARENLESRAGLLLGERETAAPPQFPAPAPTDGTNSGSRRDVFICSLVGLL